MSKCANCGTALNKETTAKTCSKRCAGIYGSRNREPGKGRTPNRVCEWCSEPFYGKPHHIKDGNARWCTRSCMLKSGWAEKQSKLHESRTGENNPNYKNGKRVGTHLSKWSISMKPGPCRSCGGPGIALHHAIPRSKAPQREVKKDLRNGIPLCGSCHQRWHVGYPIRREVFTKEEWDFISSVELTGERIEAWLDKHYPSAASIAELALDVA